MRLAFDLADEAATRALGGAVAKLVAPGDVVALRGALGAGKTTFARGLVSAAIGAEVEVPSPTYNLVQTYDAPQATIWHFDLYRLEAPGDLVELGWDEAAGGVALVEWPDRAGALLPRWRLDLTLEPKDGGGRLAVLEPRGEHWQRRLDGFRP
ncbi:MAG: tRNA (adenosine(37)-N6)-threonylcarbamoyltransferase complex ATPase subunit type 1 TsaE [Pseudomonadota bacterium]